MKRSEQKLKQYEQKWPDVVRTAVHEAGHAICNASFSAPTLGISINTSPFEYQRGFVLGGFCHENPAAMRQHLITLAAGGLAVRMWCTTEDLGDEDDQRAMRDKAWQLVGRLASEAEMQREIQQASYRADTMLRLLWPEVVRCAASLLDHIMVIRRVPLYRGNLDQLNEIRDWEENPKLLNLFTRSMQEERCGGDPRDQSQPPERSESFEESVS